MFFNTEHGREPQPRHPTVTIEPFAFGALRAEPVSGFVLRNDSGIAVTVVALGARIVRLEMPDAQGRSADVVLGFDTPEGYLASDAYMGATCGRYGSRIRGGEFLLDGTKYRLTRNEGNNHAHGGREGFDRKLWNAHADTPANEILFSLASPDRDEGYPGALDATVAYRLGDDNVLTITMSARTDRPTVVNLVHHTYWNLAGHDSGGIESHRLEIDADYYTPIDSELIPDGEVRRVDGTPFDFRVVKTIGRDLASVPTAAGGYDHHFCVRGAGNAVRRCAVLADPASGRAIEVHSDAPGLQLYTGGHFSQVVTGKGGARYGQYAGVAMETQRFPDAPNVGYFPSARLDPGAEYVHRMQIRLHPDGGAIR